MLERLIGTVCAGLLIALPLVAQPQSSDKLAERYTGLAGSTANAKSLVSGLRNDSAVTLESKSSKVTFTPPTDKMGYGNVDNALALAEASLKQKGITNPTPEQLKAALVGGTVNGKKLEGVLAMRAAGEGWGNIAHSLGIKMGDVKRSDAAAQRTETAHNVEHGARPEKPERPEKFEHPERPERPEKPEHPGRGR